MLTRFGIQKTMMDNKDATRGYIFGNAKSFNSSLDIDNNASPPVTLLVVDSDFFFDIYRIAASRSERKTLNKNQLCEKIFDKVDRIAWHAKCNPRGPLDLQRSVPCPHNQLCSEEDDANSVQPNSQFTFTIQDVKQPRYWYVMLIACARNANTCKREYTAAKKPVIVNYDLWLVNGSPKQLALNRFEHEFSFEYHDTLEMYLVFGLCYLVTTLLYQFRFHDSSSFISHLLLSHLWVTFIAYSAIIIHQIIFSSNGQGLSWLWHSGLWARNALADGLLLALMIIATQQRFHILHHSQAPTGNVTQWSLVLLLVLGSSALHIWCEIDEDAILDFDIWESVPGTLWLALRYAVCLLFFHMLLKNQFSYSPPTTSTYPFPSSLPPQPPPAAAQSRRLHNNLQGKWNVSHTQPLDFIHIAAAYFVWSLALPLSVLIAELCISPLWRLKCVLTVTYCADFMAVLLIIYILWKTRKLDKRSINYSLLPTNDK